MSIGRFGPTGCLALIVAAGIVGCSHRGEPKGAGGTLQGKVTLDSKPVLMGIVVVHSHDNIRWAKGDITRDGTYVVENAPDGPVYLYLELPPMPPGCDPRLKKSGPGFPPPGTGAPVPSFEMEGLPEVERRAWESVQNIPRQYFSTQRPLLRGFVKLGETTELDLNLSTKANGPPDPSELPGGPPGPAPPPR
jgi:hypothetical protein